MLSENLSRAIDYLQRSGEEPPLPGIPWTDALPKGCSLRHIIGIGRREKLAVVQTGGSGQQEQIEHSSTEDVITGLYGRAISLAFLVRGNPDGVALYLGTRTPSGLGDLSRVRERQRTVDAMLRSHYPVVELGRFLEPNYPEWPGILPDDYGHAGFVLGTPAIKLPDFQDGALPLDRLIRALARSRWAVLVLADPVGEGVLRDLSYQIIKDMKDVQTSMQSSGLPSPLSQHYQELLASKLEVCRKGLEIGMWRTGVYLLGDREGYSRLAGLWRGLFSGGQAQPEPIRIWDRPEVAKLATGWSLPEDEASLGPGRFQHYRQYQSFLTSSQLAAYIHVPHLETRGFPIRLIPDFDVVPPIPEEKPLFSLGQVMHHTKITQTPYQISARSLTRHVFIAGITGSGKTHTILSLLKQLLLKSDAPFLILEPAKAEYRLLLRDPHLRDRIRIFTLGDETASPFRLNPFEILPGTSVGSHLDMLRSIFVASFGLWTPLPQILEQCLHRIYTDRGWDITANENTRLDRDSPTYRRDIYDAFPTLSDLIATVDDVLRNLHYEEKIESNMRAALLTRLQSLRTGGKGAMLDVQRSLPIKEWLEQPTILELEGMGDDDDRAFVMGLLLVHLAEFRRRQGQDKALKHLLVLEEAHRLLANVGERASQEEADPRGKAVETFANLLSEIRAYGQGIIIADQVPVKLTPDVIKNTNLKIVHRVVAQDDRSVLAGAMAMNERQANALATLSVGQAVVFSEGDDAPVLVKIPHLEEHEELLPPEKQEVIEHMEGIRPQVRRFPHPFAECGKEVCTMERNACQAAQRIVENTRFQKTFARLALSIIEDSNALDRQWEDLLLVMRAQLPNRYNEQEIMSCLLTRASRWLAHRRGAQAHWPYSETHKFAQTLRQVLIAKWAESNVEQALAIFQQYMHDLHARNSNPYPICHQVCQQQPAVCLYRSAVADLVASGQMEGPWQEAYNENAEIDENRLQQLWRISLRAAYELVEFSKREEPHKTQHRVALCFAQQMLINDSMGIPPIIRKVSFQLLKEAQSNSEYQR